MADVVEVTHRIGAEGRSRDLALAELALAQHGVVALRQLFELGFGRGAIRLRVGAGRLHRLHRAVYAVGHRAITAEGRWMAAVLACGSGALLSHRTAAALWGFRPSVAAVVEVTVPRKPSRGRRGIVVHGVRRLHPDDCADVRGIPLTSVARTIFDLAELLRPKQLERAFEEAERLRLLDVRAIEAVRDRSHGRHGLRPLAELLARERFPLPDTRSELERRFVALCRDAALPPPGVNLFVAGFEIRGSRGGWSWSSTGTSFTARVPRSSATGHGTRPSSSPATAFYA